MSINIQSDVSVQEEKARLQALKKTHQRLLIPFFAVSVIGFFVLFGSIFFNYWIPNSTRDGLLAVLYMLNVLATMFLFFRMAACDLYLEQLDPIDDVRFSEVVKAVESCPDLVEPFCKAYQQRGYILQDDYRSFMRAAQEQSLHDSHIHTENSARLLCQSCSDTGHLPS
ncbi:hypothetical protein HER14_02615 [Acidithiobacillus thiooxidans]|uniref:hypothetical protein n=1 Tax=Acidithiobacillus thiooxidans TaxID=930 RepID=UPI001C06C3CD|nr:hypothetical protein [Acidithiobacillus thiooxidans]MBU2749889.1 hypothetical protein [Acidithiobacillus thiooxidans]